MFLALHVEVSIAAENKMMRFGHAITKFNPFQVARRLCSMNIWNRNGNVDVKALVEHIQKTLMDDGFDVFGSGCTDHYNASIFKASKDMELLPERSVVICVGNSRGLWNQANTLILNGERNPFNTLSASAAQKCVDICWQGGIQTDVFFSHSPVPFLVSFQHLAVETGIGVLDKPSQLVVHPLYGPWIALRFAVVIHIPPEKFLLEARCGWEGFRLSEVESAAVAQMLEGRPYSPLLHIEARRAFTTGSQYAYSNEQLSYHYHIPIASLSSITSRCLT